jgi:ureidoglycolate lyase
MDVVAERLTQEAFAPYRDVIAVPVRPGRKYTHPASAMRAPAHGEPLDGDAGAGRRLAVRGKAPRAARVFLADLRAARCWTWTWLVVVCPHAPLGGPEVAHGRALIAGPDQGISYRMNTWHHGFTVLDRPGRFAMFMWLDGSSGDEEFVPVTPFTIRLGG